MTITFCDRAENHVGMQQIGELAESGYTLDDLKSIKKKLARKGIKSKIKDLSYRNDESETNAYILIIRNGVEKIIKRDGHSSNDLWDELINLEWDTKAKMRGRVVNKHARYNLCFGDSSQEPDYEQGMGRIVKFKHLPFLKIIRNYIKDLTGDKLLAEGNYYYSEKCGIGYHGDSERKKVIGIRISDALGEPLSPLVFRWYQNSERIDIEPFIIKLYSGDIYIMSEKATGYDWKKRLIPTLRHATGHEKYTK